MLYLKDNSSEVKYGIKIRGVYVYKLAKTVAIDSIFWGFLADNMGFFDLCHLLSCS